MSHRSRQAVVLTSFRQGSLDAYLSEWRSIRASRIISQEDQSDLEEGENHKFYRVLDGRVRIPVRFHALEKF